MTRARAAVLTLAGLTLAACGSVHPGDAAVVDGQSISMKTLNQTAEAYCTVTLQSAADQGASVPDNGDLRRQAVTTLVSLVVARKIADEKGITPKRGSYELTAAQERSIATAFPKADLDQIGKAIEDSQEVSVIAIALGEASTGETRTEANQAQLAEVGQAEITKAFAANGVKFSPRFGLNSSTKAIAGTGSLSVAAVDLEQPGNDELPTAQRCS